MADSTKGIGSKIKCMEKEYSPGPQGNDMKVITKKIKRADTVDSSIPMDHITKEDGRTVSVKVQGLWSKNRDERQNSFGDKTV